MKPSKPRSNSLEPIRNSVKPLFQSRKTRYNPVNPFPTPWNRVQPIENPTATRLPWKRAAATGSHGGHPANEYWTLETRPSCNGPWRIRVRAGKRPTSKFAPLKLRNRYRSSIPLWHLIQIELGRSHGADLPLRRPCSNLADWSTRPTTTWTDRNAMTPFILITAELSSSLVQLALDEMASLMTPTRIIDYKLPHRIDRELRNGLEPNQNWV